jgi:hypothetical protein
MEFDREALEAIDSTVQPRVIAPYS